MTKRWISFLLAVVLLAGTVAVGTPTVHAYSEMHASEELIELLKELEGFLEYAQADYKHYSIGYGTSCEADDYPNGITEEEADVLLRKAVASFEVSVNNFAKQQKLTLKQHQFDALICFTYNLGASWLNNTSTLRSAVISGATGNDFIYAITMWCTAGSNILTQLVERRLIEANLYLNGVYSTKVPSRYDYVRFNSNMTDAANTVRIQGYDSDRTDAVRPTPTKSGYRFLGWYTKANGGEWVTTLDASMAGKTLYGHWQEGDGDGSGVAASYKRVTTDKVSVIDLSTGKTVKELASGTTVTITADYVNAKGEKYGKTDGGWISLSQTRALNEPESGSTSSGDAVKVTVNTDGVNIRKGPGTSYDKVGKANKGDVLTITKVRQGTNYLWGKFSQGWICLDYTNYSSLVVDSSTEGEEVIATGVVVNTDKLNVRNQPGTSGTTVVGSFYRGDVVTITETRKVGGTTWGKTSKGWISLYYVELKTGSAGSTDTDNSGNSSDSGTGTEEKVIATGYVDGCITLRVRKGPGTSYRQVGSLAAGTEVKIYETTGSGAGLWGRIDQGWISMNYVELEVEDSDSSNESGKGVSGTVYNCDKLNVRSGPGTSNKKVARINAGTKVTVFETTVVNGVKWGRISLGWVSMDYIKLSGQDSGTTQQPETPETETPETGNTGTGSAGTGSTGTTSGGQAGTIVKASEVRIRAGAGTKYDKVGTLKKGDRVIILETVQAGGATWGRTDQGWVHMYYVQLDGTTVPSGAVYKTVTTSGLRIRAGAGTSYDKVGTYNKGDVVLIYEQTTVNGRAWGRTDKGWISMEYVK